MQRPIAIDLFCGVGGMSLGLEQAGYDVVAGVEYDPIHAAAHERNFPDCTMIVAPIQGLDGDSIRRRAGIGRSEVHLVAGGPPCQGFSSMGRMDVEDDRNGLIHEFMRVVVEIRPRIFVLENVRGLLAPQYAHVLAEVLERARLGGYRVPPPRLLDASRYGVPQSRHRVIVIGHRMDVPEPPYPIPDVHTVSAREALDDLPDIDSFPDLIDSDTIHVSEIADAASSYARSLSHPVGDDWHSGHRRPIDPFLLTASMRTSHSPDTRARFASAGHGVLEPVSRFYKLDPMSPSHTLRAGTDARRGSFTSARPIHYRDPRCLSVREMARLQGFPDWFRPHRTKIHGARQIGNAVPPPLARAIGRRLLDADGIRVPASERLVTPGPDALLSFTMRGACGHYGVPDPIGRRDVVRP